MFIQIPSTVKNAKTKPRAFKKHIKVGDRQVKAEPAGGVVEGRTGGKWSASTGFEDGAGGGRECGGRKIGDDGEFEAWREDVEIYITGKY